MFAGSLSFSTMIVTSPFLLALLPFVTASRLHKLKLQKIAPAANNPELESAYLAEKYGVASQVQMQMPLLGIGGSGRRVERPTTDGNEQLFWTQEELKGGHKVPLTSLLPIFGFLSFLIHRSIDFMNAQYFTEISLGTPPQTVHLLSSILYSLTNSALVQSHPRHWVRST